MANLLLSKLRKKQFDRSDSPILTRERQRSDLRITSGTLDLDRYIIEDENLAKGSFGCVLLARDKITEEQVVIKKISPTVPLNYVETEVKAGKILNHPHIATFHNYIHSGGSHYLIFSYMGDDLFTYLSANHFEPLSESDACAIISPVILALNHSHRRKIAHMDIKLENILMDEVGHVSLIDYGLSTFVEDGKKNYDRRGSDDYLAPELLRNSSPFDPFKCDVFSAGVVLFALLFGVLPFAGLNSGKSKSPLPKLVLRFPQDVTISRSAKDLLAKMLEDDPAKRASVSDVLKHKWIRTALHNEFADRHRSLIRRLLNLKPR